MSVTMHSIARRLLLSSAPRRSRRRLHLLFLAASLTACAHGSSATNAQRSRAPAEMFVVVVRHAEKAPTPVNDQALSEEGIARAAALDATLREMTPITDVVVSHLQRTRLTAAVVAARTKARIHVVPIGADGVAAHVRAVADTVHAITGSARAGGVLVVGHSNTVTDIVAALGGGSFRPLCDSQYSQMFILRSTAGRDVPVSRSTYGAADPVDASCAAMAK
jgi:phosphohistidine phosphatase SixA